MTRTIALLLSTSALALAACAEEGAETEEASEDAADETGEAMNATGEEIEETADEAGEETEEAWNDADGAMDGDDAEGMRYTEGDENPDNDDLGQNPVVNAVQDAASVVVGTVSGGVAGLTGDPETYVRNAYLANMYQIEAGRMAAERGNSPEIQELGEMIASEHEAQQDALETAVTEADLDYDMPAELEGRRQGLLDNLGAAGETTFDSAFLQQQTQIHTELAALHNAFETTGEAEALTRFASEASDAAGEALERISANYGAAVDGE
ncbi:MAG: DUF4142 domain-containing protein [Oceanicaulis sp.]